MRRTARALTVATLAGAVVSLAPAVHAGSSAEVSPGTVAPGGTVTVTVRCDPGEGPGGTGHEKPKGEPPAHDVPGHERPGEDRPAHDRPAPDRPGHQQPGPRDDGKDDGKDDSDAGDGEGDRISGPDGGGPAAETVDASSRAFEDGTVELRRVPGDESGRSRQTTYRGTARVASGRDAEGSPEGVGPGAAWSVDGHCPGGPGDHGAAWSATFAVSRGGERPPCREESRAECGHGEQDAAVPGAVQAGDGGSFGVSVPALVAGGLLIVGAVGAALLRVRHAVRGTGGRP
ncbi:hypothetical protein [Streptomyces sp. NPDC008150]|uniref:hypothetical protein n=1 Tax=Streptomyces sp. NPDC008150 TaxID=3364816 RepID=UPI0036F0CCF0